MILVHSSKYSFGWIRTQGQHLMCILMANDFIYSVDLHCDYKRFSVSNLLDGHQIWHVSIIEWTDCQISLSKQVQVEPFNPVQIDPNPKDLLVILTLILSGDWPIDSAKTLPATNGPKIRVLSDTTRELP